MFDAAVIQQRVVQIVAEQLGFPTKDIEMHQEFVKDLGADSLDLVELCMSFEDEFNIEIPDEVSDSIHSVQQAYDALTEYLNAHSMPEFPEIVEPEEIKRPVILQFKLIKTTRRLTFDILHQADYVTNKKADGDYRFKASNGYEVISCSNMDIQTERIWLLGNGDNVRSGSMVFSSDEKRDAAYNNFLTALHEWAMEQNGIIEMVL